MKALLEIEGNINFGHDGGKNRIIEGHRNVNRDPIIVALLVVVVIVVVVVPPPPPLPVPVGFSGAPGPNSLVCASLPKGQSMHEWSWSRSVQRSWLWLIYPYCHAVVLLTPMSSNMDLHLQP